MILHLVNRSPQCQVVYQMLAESFSEGDHLLLIEDACYAALPAFEVELSPFSGAVSVLEEDLASRGLAARIAPNIPVVDMAGFVALTETYQRSLSWF